jgi:hypothetical protein
MHFATHVRTWCVTRLYSVLYSEIALSRKPFEIGLMDMYSFFLRMSDTMASENIVVFSWDTLYMSVCVCVCVCVWGGVQPHNCLVLGYY